MIVRFDDFNEEMSLFSRKSQKPSMDPEKLKNLQNSEFDRKRSIIDEYLQNHPYQVYYYPDENTVKTLTLYRLSWYDNLDRTFGFTMFFEDHKSNREEYLDVSFFKNDKNLKEIVATPGIQKAWRVLKDDMIGYIYKAMKAAGISLVDNVVTALSKIDELKYIQQFESAHRRHRSNLSEKESEKIVLKYENFEDE
jgi:hypothetical protein